MKTYNVTFKMIDHVFTATWNHRDHDETWSLILDFIISYRHRIDYVSKVEGGTDQENQTYFNAIKNTIEHYKN